MRAVRPATDDMRMTDASPDAFRRGCASCKAGSHKHQTLLPLGFDLKPGNSLLLPVHVVQGCISCSGLAQFQAGTRMQSSPDAFCRVPLIADVQSAADSAPFARRSRLSLSTMISAESFQHHAGNFYSAQKALSWCSWCSSRRATPQGLYGPTVRPCSPALMPAGKGESKPDSSAWKMGRQPVSPGSGGSMIPDSSASHVGSPPGQT